MTSPPLTEQKPQEVPVEALRALVSDLRALAGRLELKERTPGLQATLRAAQERVSGPRAVVMLLSEHADVKRQFLERLLGPVPHLPSPTTLCTRLEYGPEPECTVTMPLGLTAVLPLEQLESFLTRRGLAGHPGDASGETRQAMRSIRLPNPALKGGLAVIDTPAAAGGEPAADVLDCAEQADAWIFVLHGDHGLSEASRALLRRLPERGARLEMVVENADALSGEERLAARERLTTILREQCGIEAPRLTLVASTATEGDAANFWHGRFATFHSVMMLRGRERWLDGTRAMVLDALSKVGAEIDFELKSIGLGLRHARLRLGMKDLDGLRTRFSELEGPRGTRRAEAKAAAPQAQAPLLANRLDSVWSGGSGPGVKAEVTAGQSPLTMLAEAIAAMEPGTAETKTSDPDADAARKAEPLAPPVSNKEPAFVRLGATVASARPKRGLSVRLNGRLKRLISDGEATESNRVRLLKRVAGVALLIAFVCLILWALAPKGFLPGNEPAAQWDYPAPKPVLARPAGRVAGAGEPQPKLLRPSDTGASPDVAGAAAADIPVTPLARRHGMVRTPLVHPIPSGASTGRAQRAKRHHRHMLGLGKLWHWVRHPHHGKSERNSD